MNSFQTVWHDQLWDIRVLAFAEGYVMVRRKGCVPFVMSVAELNTEFSPGPKENANER